MLLSYSVKGSELFWFRWIFAYFEFFIPKGETILIEISRRLISKLISKHIIQAQNTQAQNTKPEILQPEKPKNL